MKRPIHAFERIVGGGVLLLLVLSGTSLAQPALTPNSKDTELGTPAYSYYLAEGIMQSYQTLFQIADTFQKKPMSANLIPRHVFARTLETLEEFETLYPGVISTQQHDAAQAIDLEKATPTEITGILNLIRVELERQGTFREYDGPRSAKIPSEVYQQLRKLGWFHRQIAIQRRIETTWDTVDLVYNTVVREILLTVYALADASKTVYTPYAFPKQPSRDIQPRHIYKLVVALYNNVMRYDSLRGDVAETVKFTEINDCDEITPADVFDLEQIVAAEFTHKYPNLSPSAEIFSNFTSWRAAQEKLAPGHTFRLLQHLFLLTEDLLAQGNINKE